MPAKKAKKIKPPSYFQEKRDFVYRMLGNQRAQNYKLDMMTAKKIFAEFDNDVDFLSKVKPPFKMDGSIKYFLTEAGMKYLKKKYLEFKFEIPKHELPVDLGVKSGDDVYEKQPRTLREFLYGS